MRLLLACFLAGALACSPVYISSELPDDDPPPLEEREPGELSEYQEERVEEECMGESTDYLCNPL